jgi:hypothetical protein
MPTVPGDASSPPECKTVMVTVLMLQRSFANWSGVAS